MLNVDGVVEVLTVEVKLDDGLKRGISFKKAVDNVDQGVGRLGLEALGQSLNWLEGLGVLDLGEQWGHRVLAPTIAADGTRAYRSVRKYTNNFHNLVKTVLSYGRKPTLETYSRIGKPAPMPSGSSVTSTRYGLGRDPRQRAFKVWACRRVWWIRPS